jgi:hypothetical protein
VDVCALGNEGVVIWLEARGWLYQRGLYLIRVTLSSTWEPKLLQELQLLPGITLIAGKRRSHTAIALTVWITPSPPHITPP